MRIAIAALVLAACTAAPSPPATPTLRMLRRGSGDGPLIVFLHGYGSRPEDLLSFSERTDLPPGTRPARPP